MIYRLCEARQRPGSNPSRQVRRPGWRAGRALAAATGISRPTIRAGKAELASGEDLGDRIRRPGAGRPSLEEKQPGIRDAVERLVDPVTRGDPESPLRWTCK